MLKDKNGRDHDSLLPCGKHYVTAVTRRAALVGLAALLPRHAGADDLQLLGGDGSSGTGLGSPFPIRASSSGPYLVDNTGNPWLMVADSGQGMSRLTVSDATTYITTRASQGFDAIQFDLVSTPYVGNNNLNYSTDDRIQPFVTGTNITQPNSNYWSRINSFVNLCAQNGMVAILNPIKSSTNSGGGYVALATAGTAGCTTYGQFLGNRYKSFPNVIWHLGNDFDDTTSTTHGNMSALANGILSTDANHLMTLELNVNGQPDPCTTYSNVYGQGSFGAIAGMNLNGIYTYAPPYGESIVGWNLPSVSFAGAAGTNRAATAPIFLMEGHYEGENLMEANTGTTLSIRKQDYWAMGGGCSGQIYGRALVWDFGTGWQSKLTSPGVSDLMRWKTFFKSLAWWKCAPDQNHQVATAGYGTPTVGGTFAADNYIPLMVATDYTCAHAYFSLGSSMRLTVNLGAFVGPVNAQWFDPTNGSYTTISGSPFSNTGRHNFSPSGKNNAGDPDWVLMLSV